MKNELPHDRFEAWWLSLAHVQLGCSDESHKSVARAAWQASARRSSQDLAQTQGIGSAGCIGQVYLICIGGLAEKKFSKLL